VILADSEVEEQVRKLATAGLSTRKIAGVIGDISQSTVVRILQKVNSGPQPILDAAKEATSGLATWPAARTALLAGAALLAVLLAVSFIVLTAAVATLAWG
jgi:hypothetical protein